MSACALQKSLFTYYLYFAKFVLSLRPTNNTLTQSFCLPVNSWIFLWEVQSSFAILKKQLNSLRRCLAIFQSWDITLLSVTSCLWASTKPALCLLLTSVFTFLPFKKPLLCAVLMSTILSSETAAAVCDAWSYLWLHAAPLELAGDRSSHSERHSLKGDDRRISMIEIKSQPFSYCLNANQEN